MDNGSEEQVRSRPGRREARGGPRAWLSRSSVPSMQDMAATASSAYICPFARDMRDAAVSTCWMLTYTYLKSGRLMRKQHERVHCARSKAIPLATFLRYLRGQQLFVWRSAITLLRSAQRTIRVQSRVPLLAGWARATFFHQAEKGHGETCVGERSTRTCTSMCYLPLSIARHSLHPTLPLLS